MSASLNIRSCLVQELAPPANPEELPKPPKTHLSISIPGSNAPVTSDPVECSEDGQYRYQYTRHFRRPEGMEGLLLMINGRVTVSVVESETNVALATGQLDVLGGFALGKSIWIGNDVALAAASEGLPASVVKVSCTMRIMPCSVCRLFASMDTQLHSLKRTFTPSGARMLTQANKLPHAPTAVQTQSQAVTSVNPQPCHTHT